MEVTEAKALAEVTAVTEVMRVQTLWPLLVLLSLSVAASCAA